MRHFRNFLYFVVGLLMSAWAVFSHAETIPATSQSVSAYVIGNVSSTVSFADACNKFVSANGFTFFEINVYSTYAQCRFLQNGSLNSQNVTVSTVAGYVCPADQGWTLSGSSCHRPDCVSPQVRQADGTCAVPCPVYDGTDKPDLTAKPANCSCPSGTKWFYGGGCRKTCGYGAGSVANAGWDIAIAKGATTACFGGCEVQHGSGGYDILKDGSHSAPATYTDWACKGTGLGSAPTPDGQPTPDAQKIKEADKHQPKCGAGEGVITSSSGNVMCLPAGTPNTSTPKVETKKKTESYSDSSTKTTETTTTTDPNTSATHTSTTTTTTPSSSGSAGMAGPVGTSTSSESKATNASGTGTGEDGEGDCDPTEKACSGKAGEFGENGDLYEKKYQNGLPGVLTEKYNALKNTPIFGVVAQLAPANLANSGQCPTWSFSGSINSKINLGGMSLAPPCYVFDAVRAILLITSLLLARRLIFGG